MENIEIIKLKEKRRMLLEKAEKIEKKLSNIGWEYDYYFSSDKEKKFKLYELPNIESYKAYMEFCDTKDEWGIDKTIHPLDNQNLRCLYPISYFNLEELAILLKTLYQFEKGKEYNIFTVGNMVEIPGLCNVYPQMHYIVGTKEKLEEFEEYNGKFYEKLDKFKFDKPQEDLIAVSQIAYERTFPSKWEEEQSKKNEYGRTMKYYEYKTVGEYATAYFKKYENIFIDYTRCRINLNEINSHKDILRIPIAKEDEFISNILYSIMIYKYQNNISILSEQDYANIIVALYNTNIDSIKEQTTKDIPRKLEYVKDRKVRSRFKDSRW